MRSERSYSDYRQGDVSIRWDEIRTKYPDQWLLIEALEAHTTPDRQRHLDRITVIELCADGMAAMNSYRKYHQAFSQREF